MNLQQQHRPTLLLLGGIALLGAAGLLKLPSLDAGGRSAGADDVMLQYQSTSFHDALYLRSTLGLHPAPEFAALDRLDPRDDQLAEDELADRVEPEYRRYMYDQDVFLTQFLPQLLDCERKVSRLKVPHGSAYLAYHDIGFLADLDRAKLAIEA